MSYNERDMVELGQKCLDDLVEKYCTNPRYDSYYGKLFMDMTRDELLAVLLHNVNEKFMAWGNR